jgi:hypothetical protein
VASAKHIQHTQGGCEPVSVCYVWWLRRRVMRALRRYGRWGHKFRNIFSQTYSERTWSKPREHLMIFFCELTLNELKHNVDAAYNSEAYSGVTFVTIRDNHVVLWQFLLTFFHMFFDNHRTSQQYGS